jgi:hypothetical protein
MKMKVPCCDLLMIIGCYGENIVDVITVHHLVSKSTDCGGLNPLVLNVYIHVPQFDS